MGGREFSCQKVTFKIEDKGSKVKVKLWVSPEVKGASFVAAEIRVAVQGQEVSIDMETGGFGNGDTAEWGKTADDLLKAEKEKKKKNADDDE